MMTTSREGGGGEMPLLVDVDGDVGLGTELFSFPYWLKEWNSSNGDETGVVTGGGVGSSSV